MTSPDEPRGCRPLDPGRGCDLGYGAAMPARLITIPFSHYCEKARWALERAGIEHVEDAHLPIFSSVASRRAGAGRTVPAFITADRKVLADSTDILHWCDAHGRAAPLFPADLPAVVEFEDDLDRHLGPAARRVGYGELLPSKRAFVELLAKSAVPAWQRRSARVGRPLVVGLLRRGRWCRRRSGAHARAGAVPEVRIRPARAASAVRGTRPHAHA